MTHLIQFKYWHFPPIFVLLKGDTVLPQASEFQKSRQNITFFWHFQDFEFLSLANFGNFREFLFFKLRFVVSNFHFQYLEFVKRYENCNTKLYFEDDTTLLICLLCDVQSGKLLSSRDVRKASGQQQEPFNKATQPP